MHELLETKLRRACTLSQFLDGILDALEETRRLNGERSRIGYVSGIVSSDGPQNISKNLSILQTYTAKVSKNFDIPAFCAGDIFSYSTFEFFEAQKIQRQHLVTFWHNVLSLGRITDIFMTPDWSRSQGATEEHKSAKDCQLKIHYLPKDFLTDQKNHLNPTSHLPKISIRP